jgi:ABC-type multidrug transport system ATPase subunit
VTEDPLDDEKEIRLCNWVRFLRKGSAVACESTARITESLYYSSSSSSNENEAELQELSKKSRVRKKVRSKSIKSNIIGRYIGGKPTFETAREIDVGNELIAYFDVQSLNPKIKLEGSGIETTESTKNKLPADGRMKFYFIVKFERYFNLNHKL